MLLRLALPGESCVWMEGAKVCERLWWRALAGALAMPERAPPSGLCTIVTLFVGLYIMAAVIIKATSDDGPMTDGGGCFLAK